MTKKEATDKIVGYWIDQMIAQLEEGALMEEDLELLLKVENRAHLKQYDRYNMIR